MLHRGSRINLYPVERQWLVPKSCILVAARLQAAPKKRLSRDREAARLYKLAADQGYPAAQAALGFFYAKRPRCSAKERPGSCTPR
jgi:TPR repeat protein